MYLNVKHNMWVGKWSSWKWRKRGEEVKILFSLSLCLSHSSFCISKCWQYSWILPCQALSFTNGLFRMHCFRSSSLKWRLFFYMAAHTIREFPHTFLSLPPVLPFLSSLCVFLRMRCWVYTDQITLTNVLHLSVRVHLIAGAVVCCVVLCCACYHIFVLLTWRKKINYIVGNEI